MFTIVTVIYGHSMKSMNAHPDETAIPQASDETCCTANRGKTAETDRPTVSILLALCMYQYLANN